MLAKVRWHQRLYRWSSWVFRELGAIKVKFRVKKILMAGVVLVFAALTIASCGSSDENTWDSIKALPEGIQPTVLPQAENLNAYATLQSFARISPDLNAEPPFPFSGNTETLNWNPESCFAAAQFFFYGQNWQLPDSEFSRSLGSGWQQRFKDSDRGRTLTFRIFSDLAASEMALIEILERDINACPIAIQQQQDVTWNHEFKVRKDSENTITIITQYSNSKGLVGNSLTSVNQVGRNLIASQLVLFDWNGNPPPPVSAEQEKDLISSWTVMAAKVLAQQVKE
jgi:hypothetical protein